MQILEGVLAYDETVYKLYKDFTRFTFPHLKHHGSTSGGKFNDNKQLHSNIEPSSKPFARSWGRITTKVAEKKAGEVAAGQEIVVELDEA
ncbi:hypothetical protein TIFTF001_019476 [Ficus carica]|uniref:Uncharacterized protein n=1 Tax=Ficus carica TaxID=3494 RepID=A0AA88AEE0_FICCA|nr:hypothetical protein TIFTF001_019476 [Ficus carica]